MVATHLYRITQEAINNALKHGRPSRLRVSLENQRGRIVLTFGIMALVLRSNHGRLKAWAYAPSPIGRE